MELQNSHYIPVRHLTNRFLTYAGKEIVQELFNANEKIIELKQKNQELKQKNQEIGRKIINNYEKIRSFKPILERGLEWLKTRQAEHSKEPNVASKTNIAKAAYATASKISKAITQINNIDTTSITPINKQQVLTQADFMLDLEDYRKALNHYNTVLKGRENQPLANNYSDNIDTTSITPINKQQVLTQADFMLDLEDYRKALNHYNTVLKGRENQPLANNYRPVEEKLRQASKLYMEFRPIIERLDITNALKKNLFCTGISAHTQGAFALSKAEVLHMLNNQFFYSV